jgi:hypothetical protein
LDAPSKEWVLKGMYSPAITFISLELALQAFLGVSMPAKTK